MDYSKELKVLAIGNSFSDDAMEYLYRVAEGYGVEKIVLGNLYIGGCSLELHHMNSLTDEYVYAYRKNTSGIWETTLDVSLKAGILDEVWDVFTLQQVSYLSGIAESYQPQLHYLIKYVKELQRNPRARIGWHMTWAYQEDSVHPDFHLYQHSQMQMYQAIIAAVKENIVPNKEIDFIIPAGTAIQNLRTSFLGDTSTRDGFHLSFDIGRFTAGLAYFQAITGFSTEKISYLPEGVSEKAGRAIKEAVANACEHPFAITYSIYQK
jgi:hypothetical protein